MARSTSPVRWCYHDALQLGRITSTNVSSQSTFGSGVPATG